MPSARKPRRPNSADGAAPIEFAPAVCRAGLFQFAPQQRFTNGCVQSRALFWCRSGRGRFVVNGVTHELEPNDLYVLPWNRCITYLPSEDEPMFTAHVHLVPCYRPGSRWAATVPHEAGEAEFDSADRADGGWLGSIGVLRLHLTAQERLGRLIDYGVNWYLESDRGEREARALATLLTAEVAQRVADSRTRPQEYPEELRRLLVHVDRGFQLGPTVADLGRLIGRSRSHVLKLFRRHLGVSAKEHIVRRQLAEARALLLSSTLPVGEVGSKVGQADPYHFSKLFRRHVGLSPREFRERNGPFSSRPRPSGHVALLPPASRPSRPA